MRRIKKLIILAMAAVGMMAAVTACGKDEPAEKLNGLNFNCEEEITIRKGKTVDVDIYYNTFRMLILSLKIDSDSIRVDNNLIDNHIIKEPEIAPFGSFSSFDEMRVNQYILPSVNYSESAPFINDGYYFIKEVLRDPMKDRYNNYPELRFIFKVNVRETASPGYVVVRYQIYSDTKIHSVL